MLYSRPFFRHLRRTALAQIKLSQTLRQAYKAHRGRFAPQLKLFVAYALVGLVVVAWLFGLAKEKPALALTVIALYATGTAVLRSNALFARLNGAETFVFSGLPMADGDFFRLQWKKFLVRVCWLLIPTSVAYVTVAITREPDVPNLLASLLAVLAQCLVVTAAAPLLLNVRSRFLIWTAVALYGVGAFAVFFLRYAVPALTDLTMLFPAGWINRGDNLLLNGDTSGLLWYLPAAGIAVLGFARLRGVRESYQPTTQKNELVGEESDESWPRAETSLDSLPYFPDQAQPIRDESTAVPAPIPIELKQLDLAIDWTAHGWLERLAGAWLTREERIVADFLTGERLGQWTKGWIKAFYLTAATVALVAFVPSVPTLVSNITAFLAASLAAPLLGGHWLGFAPVQMWPQQSFAAAFYPVSYWRVSGVIFKINLVRLAGWFILLLPVCIAFTWRHGATPSEGLFIALKILYLTAIAQFVAIMAKHSKGTNDTKRWSLDIVAFLIFILFAITIAIIAILVSLFREAPGGWAVGGLVVAVLAVLTWWLYGLLYNRGRFDLLCEPDSRF